MATPKNILNAILAITSAVSLKSWHELTFDFAKKSSINRMPMLYPLWHSKVYMLFKWKGRWVSTLDPTVDSRLWDLHSLWWAIVKVFKVSWDEESGENDLHDHCTICKCEEFSILRGEEGLWVVNNSTLDRTYDFAHFIPCIITDSLNGFRIRHDPIVPYASDLFAPYGSCLIAVSRMISFASCSLVLVFRCTTNSNSYSLKAAT